MTMIITKGKSPVINKYIVKDYAVFYSVLEYLH